MFKLDTRKAVVATLVVFAAGLAACAPPKDKLNAKNADEKTIVVVQKKNGEIYKTVDIDGVEYRQARGAVGKPGGTFYMSQIGEGPKTFNAWASYDATSTFVADMMLTGLVETDAYTGEVVPALAKMVEVSEDNTTYTVTLRKGLTWSDGKPITSKDVVFTWKEILEKGLGNPSSRDVMLVDGEFPSVRAIDALTIEFKTAKPFAPFLRNMSAEIAPEHIFKPIIAKGGDKAFSAAWGISQATEHPEQFVSNGMWLLEEYNPTEHRVTYKKNPRYYMVDRGGTKLPYLHKFMMSFVKNMNNQQLQFEQGKMDVYSVPSQFVSHVRKQKSPDFSMYNLGPTTSTAFLTFNLNNRKDAKTGKSLVDPVHSKWFRNLNFRKAVDWAVSREDMVANILKGVGTPLFTAESPNSLFINEKLVKGHPRDIEKAKAYLTAGGFTWNDAGKLFDSEGNLVEFTLMTNTGNDQRENTGVAIKQDLADVGIQVNFKPVEFNVLVGKMNRGEWDAMIMGLTGGLFEPNNGVNVWRSDGGLHMFNQRDVKAGKPDLSDRLDFEAELDTLFAKGAKVLVYEDRKAIYDSYQEVVSEHLPFIYLYSPLRVIAVKNRIQNFDPSPMSSSVLHNLEEFWVKDESGDGAKI